MLQDTFNTISEWIFFHYGPWPPLNLPLIASMLLAAMFLVMSIVSAGMWMLGHLRGTPTYSARRWFWLDLGLGIGFGAIHTAILGLSEVQWLVAAIALFLVSVTLVCTAFRQQ